MKLCVDQIDEFRSVFHRKVTKLPCELEKWASTGEIDAGLGLNLVDILYDEFFISFLIDDTNVK